MVAAPALVLANESHKHKYCHTHNADKNRTRKVQTLVDSSVETTEIELRPVTRKHLRTVMKKEERTASHVVQVPKTVTETKTVMETKNRDVTKSRMVKTQVKQPQTSWVPQTTTEKAWRTVKKTVMHNRTVASTVQLANDCSCYQQQCGCQGQWNCGCCYPTCGCAPSAPKTTTKYSTVQVPVEVSVNEQYDRPVTRHVAVTRDVLVDRWVPQQYTETETYQSPK